MKSDGEDKGNGGHAYAKKPDEIMKALRQQLAVDRDDSHPATPSIGNPIG